MRLLWLLFNDVYRKIVHYGLIQGQITLNNENKHVFKLIHLVAKCSKVTNTMLLLKCILHNFSIFLLLFTRNVRMSEGTFCRVEVHLSVLLQQNHYLRF